MFEEVPESSEGKFKLRIEMPESPKKAQDAWNSTKPTTLLRADPVSFCLAFDGDFKKDYSGTDYFVACGLLSGLVPGACAFGTHAKPGRPCMDLPGPAYVIKLHQAPSVTKV